MTARAFDTHIHLDQLKDLDQQLVQAVQEGIANWVIPGVNKHNWQTIQEIAQKRPGVFFAPGIHPQAADTFSSDDLCQLKQYIQREEAVAIGEVGLDRYVKVSIHEQKKTFSHMVQLAVETKKPLLIHQRKSLEDVLDILRYENAEQVSGIFHAFSGSLDSALKIIQAGFYIGVGGVVTWGNARRLPKVVEDLPSDSFVLESDAPFMTPEPYRGTANRSAYLMAVARKVSSLRGWPVEKTLQITTENARRVFKLRPP